MTQSLVTLNLTDAQLTAADAALTELETQFAGLIALDVAKRKSLKKMGRKSESFCRQAVRVLEQNPQIVPASVPVADAVAGLNALEALRPRMIRLARLSERATDTDIALGSDVMAVALQGYSLLKVSGRSQGLEGLRNELGVRFSKTPRQPKSGPPPVVALEKAA
ncbi:MAG TPA: hypothetical protein VLJ39_04870 [Tepidisphaeraceae bacterium]|nr:hypothetical protein [Tepidisphaeraceae bacterium]